MLTEIVTNIFADLKISCNFAALTSNLSYMNPYIYTFKYQKDNCQVMMSYCVKKRNLADAMHEFSKEYGVPVSALTLVCFYDMTKDEE